jgi:hypothetical protein
VFPSCTHQEPSASFAASAVKTQAKSLQSTSDLSALRQCYDIRVRWWAVERCGCPKVGNCKDTLRPDAGGDPDIKVDP